MRLVPEIVRKGTAFYRRRGLWSFIKATSIYLLKEWRFSPFARGIVLRKGRAGKLKVLYVDMISAPHAKSNVNGRIKAYSKVSTLMTFDDRKLARRYGQSRMNERLIKAAVKFKPDLIQLGKAELVYGSTIKEIKSQINTCVIHFYGDFRWEPQDWVIDIGRYADYTLFYHKETALNKQYEELGVRNTGFWLVGTDPDIFYPREREKTYDIAFMANNPNDFVEGHKIRRELIAAITGKGFDLHIFGNGWEYLSRVPNVHIHPFVDLEKFAEVCSSSKVTLGTGGLGANNDAYMYNSWRRTFNSMASGAFHLTHYVPGLEEVFENKKHLVWFNSVPEATELIEYYLAHDEERERIAEAGRQEVLAHHTWDARIAEILKKYQRYKPNQFDKRVRCGQYKENPELNCYPVQALFRRWQQERYLLEPPQSKMYENVAKLIKGLDICDVGCGAGLGSLMLAREAKSVVGMEKIEECTQFAQQCFPMKNITFVNQDIIHCTYPDDSFDAVVAIEVIEHISNYRGALIAIKRILKNNGKLCISSPNRNSERLRKHRPTNKYHCREWSVGEFYEILSSYFTDVEVFDCTLMHQQGMDSQMTPVIAICRNDKRKH